jgi:hypothetical protein
MQNDRGYPGLEARWEGPRRSLDASHGRLYEFSRLTMLQKLVYHFPGFSGAKFRCNGEFIAVVVRLRCTTRRSVTTELTTRTLPRGLYCFEEF